MGRTSGDAAAVGKGAAPNSLEDQAQLNRLLEADLRHFGLTAVPAGAKPDMLMGEVPPNKGEINPAWKAQIILSRRMDDLLPAPSSVTERLWDVTAEQSVTGFLVELLEYCFHFFKLFVVGFILCRIKLAGRKPFIDQPSYLVFSEDECHAAVVWL